MNVTREQVSAFIESIGAFEEQRDALLKSKEEWEAKFSADRSRLEGRREDLRTEGRRIGFVPETLIDLLGTPSRENDDVSIPLDFRRRIQATAPD